MKTNNDIILNITHSPTKRKFRRQVSVLELDDLIEQMKQFVEDAHKIVQDADEITKDITITCSSCCNRITFFKSFTNCFKRNKLKN